MARHNLTPVPTPPTPLRSPLHSHSASFPIIAVAIIGILATALLLVGYYVFVIKCCFSWQRADLLRWFSFSRRRRRVDDPLSSAVQNRGLHESVIRSIPVFRYKKDAAACECAVCLNEFEESELLRIIPDCRHVFHIDCIDVWFQNNANCPLCRRNIISSTSHDNPPRTTPQDPILNPRTDDARDCVAVTLHRRHGGMNQSGERLVRQSGLKRAQHLTRLSSTGVEWIDARQRDDQFAIKQIRRSFSMSSAADRLLYLEVQETARQASMVADSNDVCDGHGSCSSRVKRSFFSFGHGRGSRNAVQPVHLEP